MWHDTRATRRLGIRYPIVQGPFGGGLSSPRLAAAVSNEGGLGSFGAQGMPPDRITEIVREIRGLTDAPFAMNLWVSTEDPGALDSPQSGYAIAIEPLAEFFQEFGLEPPSLPVTRWPAFADQVAALLEAGPPVFSFVFGIPPAAVLEECRRRGIVTIGAATTAEEALALEQAEVDLVVASGAEAGGHRDTMLTRRLTGRLARGLRNRLAERLEQRSAPVLPYPLQSQLVGALREEALRRRRFDLVTMWGGQSAPLLRHHRAAELFRDLVDTAERIGYCPLVTRD